LKNLLTINDLTRILRCSKRHVWRLVEKGDMPPPIKIGSASRWKTESINNWLKEKDKAMV